MDSREDLKSINAFLPPVLMRSSRLLWPPKVEEALKAMSKGPQHSKVTSGDILFIAITDIRRSLSLASQRLATSASLGYAFYFQEVLPALANLLLRFPSLLESHYQSADDLLNGGKYGCKTGLRLLHPQEAGMVLLSQELIGALLACSFFCLFPINNRRAKHLPIINFDNLFANLYDSYSEKQKNKIKCILHYFERIYSWIPTGFVSFERKVLPLECHPRCVSYPKADLWSKSVIPLCHFKVHTSGLIEDQSGKALEVDFADKYIGGGTLKWGCVQEEIHFMINPELIAGMLFLPCMADKEAIEIVGAERFSDYTGHVLQGHHQTLLHDCLDLFTSLAADTKCTTLLDSNQSYIPQPLLALDNSGMPHVSRVPSITSCTTSFWSCGLKIYIYLIKTYSCQK